MCMDYTQRQRVKTDSFFVLCAWITHKDSVLKMISFFVLCAWITHKDSVLKLILFCIVCMDYAFLAFVTLHAVRDS